jgi:hypothetical protein
VGGCGGQDKEEEVAKTSGLNLAYERDSMESFFFFGFNKGKDPECFIQMLFTTDF